MNVTFDNRSHLPDATVQEVVDFLAAFYPDVGKVTHVTLAPRPQRWSVWGKAYWPHRGNGRKFRTKKWGRFDVRVFVGGLERPEGYPYEWTYKEAAGPVSYANALEGFVHVLAHELRHVCQFRETEVENPGWRKMGPFSYFFKRWQRALPYASCEVDAERYAHRALNAWRARGTVEETATPKEPGTP